jgi:hypothetical protein
MNDFEKLASGIRSLDGRYTLHEPHSGRPAECASTLEVAPTLGERFVRLDYAWNCAGKPQEGSLLLGWEKPDGPATAHWIDSWHMGRKVMACAGGFDADGAMRLRGAYAAPPGPDWGWSTLIRLAGVEVFISMWNIDPDGREEIAVESVYG